MDTPSTESWSSVLVVQVAELRVAWPVELVREVLRTVAIEELPGAPAVIAGVVDLRGVIVPVIDLRQRLGYPERPVSLDDRLVAVALDGATTLVRVDHVLGLERLDRSSVEPLTGDLAASPHLSGIARAPEGLLYVQDAADFLTDREAASLRAALVPAGHDA